MQGGTLRVGDWGPDLSDRYAPHSDAPHSDAPDSDATNSDHPDSAAPTVIAVHGITASHLAWAVIARSMPPHVRLIAPDLRGRGRSSGLPGPYGMARHAADLEAVIEALHLPRATLVGHSMGGFVAVVAAHLYPDRFSGMLLIDGGLPLAVPAGISRENLLEATLGPAARRLSMTFPDHATYLEFWKQHPAFAEDLAFTASVAGEAGEAGEVPSALQTSLAEYASYDLTGTEPELRPSASLEAVKADMIDLYVGGAVRAALRELKGPVSVITAPRGLLNETPGLYSPNEVERWRAELPGVKIRVVPDVNHYTILMGAAGAADVAREVLRAVSGPQT